MTSDPQRRSEADLIADARVRAGRLVEDLSDDQADLRARPSRVICDEDRREADALLAGAIAAAGRLHDALNRSS